MRLQQALDSVKPTKGPCDRETKMEDRGKNIDTWRGHVSVETKMENRGLVHLERKVEAWRTSEIGTVKGHGRNIDTCPRHLEIATLEGHGRKRPKVINEHLQSGARIGADRKIGTRRHGRKRPSISKAERENPSAEKSRSVWSEGRSNRRTRTDRFGRRLGLLKLDVKSVAWPQTPYSSERWITWLAGRRRPRRTARRNVNRRTNRSLTSRTHMALVETLSASLSVPGSDSNMT